MVENVENGRTLHIPDHINCAFLRKGVRESRVRYVLGRQNIRNHFQERHITQDNFCRPRLLLRWVKSNNIQRGKRWFLFREWPELWTQNKLERSSQKGSKWWFVLISSSKFLWVLHFTWMHNCAFSRQTEREERHLDFIDRHTCLPLHVRSAAGCV